MKREKGVRDIRCWWHRWKAVRDTGFTVYQECRKCKERRVWQKGCGVYQPVDWSWLESGEWAD